MPDSEPLHFFDIDSTLPGAARSWSPNTLKVRAALNFKGVQFTQSWVSYPDIEPLIKSFGLSPNEKGLPYTLPTIVHSSVKSNPHGALMDSLPIIEHLDKTFPSSPFFPSGDASYAIAIAVRRIVSRGFGTFMNLVVPQIVPYLDPRGQEYFKRTRKEWFGKPVQDIYPKDEAGFEEAWKPFEAESVVLLEMLKGREGKKGPFFEGEVPSWADLLLVSHFVWAQRVNPIVAEKIFALGNGEFKAQYDACLPWFEIQGEEREWPIPQSA